MLSCFNSCFWSSVLVRRNEFAARCRGYCEGDLRWLVIRYLKLVREDKDLNNIHYSSLKDCKRHVWVGIPKSNRSWVTSLLTLWRHMTNVKRKHNVIYMSWIDDLVIYTNMQPFSRIKWWHADMHLLVNATNQALETEVWEIICVQKHGRGQEVCMTLSQLASKICDNHGGNTLDRCLNGILTLKSTPANWTNFG